MPDHIRLIGLIANGVVAVGFALLAIGAWVERGAAMGLFFLAIAGTAGFSWHVIRKSARVLAAESWKVAQLQQRLREIEQGRRGEGRSIEAPAP